MIHTKLKPIAITGICALFLTSCATLFTKSSQDVEFKGVPGTVLINKQNSQQITEIKPNGFGSATLKNQKKITILATKEGYNSQDFILPTKIKGAFWANIILGGIPGMAVDLATGKMNKFDDKTVDVTLRPVYGSIAEPQVEVPFRPETVTRENPGATDAEKTILRWYFDSDPRGARIFWRVISNVPAEVKNTNEAYLTTTPLEETRSFNIPGLNMHNANNVTIEIKVTKRGYEDQVKRLNVRQAIDQQEISGFFELVPKTNN